VTEAGPGRVLVLWCPDWPQVSQDAEARAFEQVVAVVEEFCPRVEVLRPGACAIGVRGPARYFGGETALARKIVAAVAERGIACQAGLAEGLFAAQLAARAGAPGAVIAVAPGQTREFLAAHPVSVLGSEELADLLSRLGIRSLGEFAALPAREVVNRFGTAGVLAHRLACGLDPRPLVTRPVPADLSVRMEFDPPAELAEPVVFAAKALAERMHARLAASGLACVRVQVTAMFADGREITRLWRHDGLLSALAVAERVRWQLAAWPGQAGRAVAGRGEADRDVAGRGEADRDVAGRGGPRGGNGGGGEAGEGEIGGDEADGGEAGEGEIGGSGIGGIAELRLIPDQLVRDGGRQLGLWGDAVVSDRVARAALRVQAMLGHGAVTRPVLAGGRSPAEQVTLVPFGDARDPALPTDRPWPGRIPAPGPATVCQDPLPARIADSSGAEVTVTGRAQVSAPPARVSVSGGPWLEITAWAGPWPVTERWWRPRLARRRARFQLVTDDGTAWLAVVQDGRWLIEATYD
jgi:protein ImuB